MRQSSTSTYVSFQSSTSMYVRLHSRNHNGIDTSDCAAEPSHTTPGLVVTAEGTGDMSMWSVFVDGQGVIERGSQLKHGNLMHV